MDTGLITESTATDAAAAKFASALGATREFQAWEEAALRVRTDPSAQRASAAYQKRVDEWRLDLMLRSITPSNQAELDRLHDALFSEPSVVAYAEAEAALRELCRVTADRLSSGVGLDYVGCCAPGCCG